ncbi:MAG: site-2 protease family protein [Candidatus Promineifilaceae bacterium]
MFERIRGHSVTWERAAALRQDIGDLFAVDNVTLDRPVVGQVRFHGNFLCRLESCFDELRGRFEAHGFTPIVREEAGRPMLIGVPGIFAAEESNWVANLALLILTVLSTLWVGALSEFAAQGRPGAPGLSDLALGLPYSLSLMTILGAHELGHYFAGRHHKTPVTLPYFIPFPLPPVGTMGAFIRLKAPIKNRRALLDIGAAGPLAGLVFAIPILLYGLSISPVQPLPAGGYNLEGNSILYALAKLLVKGQFLPANGQDVFLSQIAWAGWVGLLVTGLNLIPVGQLDGGHIAYALLGRRARLFYWPVIAGLVALALLSGTLMWGIWAALVFFLGRYHAEPLDDATDLDAGRRSVALFSLLLFVLVFVPVPLRQVL